MPTIAKLPKKRRDYTDYNGKREKRQSVYNTTRWREMRLAKLMRDPLCEICKFEGRTTLAEDVHHAHSFLDVPESEMLRYAFDSNNLISVCKECHARCHTGDLQGTKSLADIEQYIEAHIKCNSNNHNDR